MKKILCLLGILFFFSKSFAQENQYEEIKRLYDNFQFDKVIQVSNNFLTNQQLPDSIKIDVHLIRAVSFFTLGNNEQTKNCFKNILLINKNYSPTSQLFASQLLNPTLLKMFNTVKMDYLRKITDEESRKDSIASVAQLVYKKQLSFGGSFVKNMILPGWGQLSLGKDRGLLYSIAYLANLGALIYYTSDAGKKQDAYQRETDDLKFNQLYSDYNKSYKIRNGLFVLTAAVLLLSQIDLLIFHDEEPIQQDAGRVSIFPSQSMQADLSISFKLPISY